MTDEEPELVTNGDVQVTLPPLLAELLIENRGWRKGRTRKGRRSLPDDKPIPMTHIPGVVPGVTMNEIKAWVADGTVPYISEGRTKLVKPSDAAAANAAKDARKK